MRISWNWLRTLIDTDLSPQQAAEVLTSTGLEVESVEVIEQVKGMLAGVVVGHVLSCDRHADADRLRVCSVDIGVGDPLGIVCGAPNVAVGQKVLVATVGTTLFPLTGDPLTIKKSKIRGVESTGMICAEDELGLGESHDGIMVLDPATAVGTSAADLLGLKRDFALEIGLTPNRADAMSHIGVARDLAAALSVRSSEPVTLKWPDVGAFQGATGTEGMKAEVLAPIACTRYAGITLCNVKVGPSPNWLRDRLKSIGLKPINNVVDVTNFVQHELGQPLHAFDADKLAGRRIVVRMASEGELFATLDGKERKLSTADLVIADAEKPVCLAGVFGGSYSGVSETTMNVFLESACFDATTVRRTARRFGLNTDASFRFERGVDPEITVYALKRAALLLKEIVGAEMGSDIVDLHAVSRQWMPVRLSFARVNGLIGTFIDPAEIIRVLKALDCRVTSHDSVGAEVEVPPYRVDVTREADLVEEIIRIIGFDRVPVPERLMMPALQRSETTLDGLQRQLSVHLAARGFREVMTPSLVNSTRTLALNTVNENELVRLKNPLSAELDVLRPSMLFGLLQSASHNMARQQRDLRLFEKGRVYSVVGDRVVEQDRTAILITGQWSLEHWRGKSRVTELADLKAEVELLLERCGVTDVEQVVLDLPLCSSVLEVRKKDQVFARIGSVRSEVLKAFNVSQPVFFAELNDATWFEAIAKRKIKYSEVPKFPSVRRDLSLLLDASVTFDQLEKLARQSERKLLRTVDLFDVYEGEKLPGGKKSYALSFILQDADKTLTDEQVDKAMGRIRQAFEKEVGAELRS